MKQRSAKGLIYCLICLFVLSPLYFIQSIDGTQTDLQTSIQYLQQLDCNAESEDSDFYHALRGAISSLREIAGLHFFMSDRSNPQSNTDSQEKGVFYRHPLLISGYSYYTKPPLLMPSIDFSAVSQYTSIVLDPSLPPPIATIS